MVEGEAERPYTYPSLFFRESLNGGGERLVLGRPDSAYVELLLDLARTLPEPFRLLYVLVVPRDGSANAGRYQCPAELSYEELAGFLNDYHEFFECDGRHHLWIANPDFGNLVFDRHNVVYAYGDLTRFEEVAEAHKMSKEQFAIPGPHWHAYHAEYDAMEHRLLKRWDWIHSPLRPQDEA